jgi:DNA invertase Pin-like site-specific DNA recombinase
MWRGIKNMFDAHIICRFSSQDKEDDSVERQKAQCLEVAQKLGCMPERTKVIANDNLSGALSWNKRIDLLELETDIKQGLCQKVIVYRFDRLARDFEVSGKLLNLLREYNIQLYDEGGNLDYLTAAGEAFFGMKSIFASFERRMIRDRMYAGKLYHFKQGKNWGGPLPLGLRREGKKVIEDREQMKIVNAMFNLIAQGWSIKQIEQWTIVNGVNLKKPRENGGICDWSIKSILTNRLYVTGEYAIKTQKEGRITQKISLTSPVAPELFDKVQSILRSRTPGRPRKGTYLLSGLVYPVLPLGEDLETREETGETVSNGEAWGTNPKIRFRAMSKNGIPCYYCKKWGELRRKEGIYIKGQGKRHRKQFSLIPKEKLENIVWNALEKMAENPKTLLQSINTQTAVMEADRDVLSNLITNKERQIRRLELTLNRFYDAFGLTGDQDDFQKIQTTKQELNKVRKELTEVRRKYESTNLTLEDASELLDTFKMIHDLRINGSPEVKLAFIQKYVKEVAIDPRGNIQIKGAFEVAAKTEGAFGRWAKGRLMLGTLISHNSNNVESSQVVP